MKSIKLLTSALFLFLFLMSSCNNANNTKAITLDEKEVIEKAISEKIDEIIKGAKALDVDAAAKPYAAIPEFLIVNPDGTVTDLQTMKNTQTEGFKSLESMNFTTLKKQFTFLSKNIVICTWTGSNEFELKTGEKMKIDPYVGSLVFKKMDGEWKIVYAHETTAAPILVNN